MEDSWAENLPKELYFWKQVMEGTHPNSRHNDWFKFAIKGVDVAPLYLIPYIKSANAILDVGSGPYSVLGKFVHGKELNITLLDPLAEEYVKLFKLLNINPPSLPIAGCGENIDTTVEGKFDFVFSRNALDHCSDPLLVIQNMVDALTPNGIVFIETRINEGINQNYQGLHQWNFMLADGDLIVFNRKAEAHIVSKRLRFGSFNHMICGPGRPGEIITIIYKNFPVNI